MPFYLRGEEKYFWVQVRLVKMARIGIILKFEIAIFHREQRELLVNIKFQFFSRMATVQFAAPCVPLRHSLYSRAKTAYLIRQL
jgi:hypothetical protein